MFINNPKVFQMYSAHDCISGHSVKFAGLARYTCAPSSWGGGVDINNCTTTAPTCWYAAGTIDTLPGK
jgi:hypothetical protein